MSEVGDKERSRVDHAGARLAQLKEKVERATQLIAELRGTNYALTGELAALKNNLKHEDESLEDGRDQNRHAAMRPMAAQAREPAKSQEPSRSHEIEPAVHEELQMLRDERKIIRAKVQNLLERIEKLEL